MVNFKTRSASADFTIKQGCLEPDLRATLVDSTGTAISLATASGVRFHMRSVDGGAAKVDAEAEIIAPASGGVVEYAWSGTDTDTVGLYYGEFEVAWDTGEREIVPNDEGHPYVNIQVLEALA